MIWNALNKKIFLFPSSGQQLIIFLYMNSEDPVTQIAIQKKKLNRDMCKRQIVEKENYEIERQKDRRIEGQKDRKIERQKDRKIERQRGIAEIYTVGLTSIKIQQKQFFVYLVYLSIYIYIYISIHLYIYLYIYIYCIFLQKHQSLCHKFKFSNPYTCVI